MIFDSPEANQRLSDTAAEAPPATFMERFYAADKQGQLRGTVLSPGFAVSEDYDRRIKDIKDAGLGDLSDLNPMWNSKPTPRAPHVYSEGHSIYDMEPSKAVEDPHEAFQKKLEQLQRDNPDKAHIIKADKPITGSESYQAAKKAAEDAAAAYGGPPLTGPIADFAGGMWSMRKDPFQVGTLVIGPMSPVRQGAKAVLTMGLKQAAANAAVEASLQPFVQSWRKSMNDSYGWWAAAEEIGMAGAFGLGADAGVRMLYRGAQARMGRKAVLDEQGRVVGYESGAKAAEREALTARNLEIQKNLEALPKDTLDKVAQGDEEATIALAKALKADEDPSVGGAINALRNTDRVTLDGIDDGWRERSLIQQFRALEDPSEPAPVHFDAATKAERPRLADDAELPKGTEGNQHYRMLDIDGKPVRFEAVDANRITTDPATFQFKGGRDSAGASNALRAVDFDGRYKGKVIVYEREDGSLVVADGHDRVSLANRAPEPQKLDALIFREADGWTAEQVRAEAARKNIQEGTGSLMDVAGAIRRHSEIVDDSMAVSTDFMADARSIARLSDEAFDAVAGGQFNPKHGVLVSDHVPDQSRHMEVLRELDRRNPPTEAAARREIGNMLREPANIETLMRVMDIPLAEPHVIEARNDVLAGVMTTLRQEPGYIGEIETQAIAAVIRRLAEKPGLVSDTLAQAGRAVAEGQPLERAIDATLRRFEDVIGKAGVKGLADQPVRLSPTDERPRFLATLAGSDAAVGRSMRADLDRLGYYSKALEAAKSLKQSRGTPEQMLAQLKAAGVKDAEIEATNLRSFLDGKTSITRDDIVKHLTENRVGVKEKQYGYKQDGWIVDPLQWGAQGETKRFASQAEAEAYAQSIGLTREHVEQMHAKGKWQNYSLDPSNPTYRETVLHLPSKMNDEMRRTIANGGWVARLDVGDFRSGHFSEPNIIGHMMTSMNRHEGKPVFTLDQIQSDWGQKLRDGGVRDEAKIAKINESIADIEKEIGGRVYDPNAIVELRRQLDAGRTGAFPNTRNLTDAEKDNISNQINSQGALEDLYQRRRLLRAELDTAQALTPGHPLVNTTDQWTNTTLRRALRQAAEADAEFIAIPSGDTVLSYNPGDEAGMRGFYGSRTSEGIVPKNLRKLLEKIDKDSAKPALIDKLETPSGMKGSGFTLFPLTDKVKKSILEEGQPLFAKPAENITSTKLNEFAENLRQALDEATTPPPGRLDDPIKDAPKQVERLREDLAEDIAAVMPPKLAAAEMPKAKPEDGIPSLVDLYQRYSTQGREALDAVMPGTGRMIDEFVQANPEVVARIAEALGAPTGRPQAAQMLEQAMPQFMNPRIIDMSKPVLLTPEANARMPDIRRELDRTVQMLPPEYRIRVEDSLVFNFGDGDKRLDGLHDGYEKLIYVSMAAGDPVRTSRHEVIHALRQSGLMKDEEFAALYKFADRLGLRKAYEIDAQYKEPYTQAYGNRGADFVEQLLREETVANMFSDYSLNGRRFGDVAGGGMVDRLIDMIVSFMKQIRDIMGGYGFRNVYDVFESIESGAMARRGMGDAPQASRLAMFAGENAKTADLDALAKAKQMDAEGKPREAIWTDTGWFKGVDGKWRFEISDHEARWQGGGAGEATFGAAKDVLPHSRLFEAYPNDSEVLIRGNKASKEASFDDWPAIVIGGLVPDKLSSGLHELQHLLQNREGFAKGGNPSMFVDSQGDEIAALMRRAVGNNDRFSPEAQAARDATWKTIDANRDAFGIPTALYRMMAGEAEARLVQKRMNMTPEERRARPPWLDYDVPEADQIVRMANEAIQMSLEDKPLARDLADVQRDREGHDVLGACRA